MSNAAETTSASTETAVSSDQGRNASLVRLLHMISVNDQEAFHRLHQLVRAPLLRVALKACGNAHDSEEIVQEVFVSIWRNAHTYNVARAAPMTWMCAIVRNQAYDVHRRTRLWRREEAWMDYAEYTERAVPSASNRLELGEEIAELGLRLSMLSPSQRNAVELTWLHCLTHEEAAHKLNKPLGTVKTLVRRGLLNLRATRIAPPVKAVAS